MQRTNQIGPGFVKRGIVALNISKKKDSLGGKTNNGVPKTTKVGTIPNKIPTAQTMHLTTEIPVKGFTK